MKETKYAGTQTEKNLMAAFAGESEARNKYTYFASCFPFDNETYLTLSDCYPSIIRHSEFDRVQ